MEDGCGGGVGTEVGPETRACKGPKMVCPWDSTVQGSLVFIFMAFYMGSAKALNKLPRL